MPRRNLVKSPIRVQSSGTPLNEVLVLYRQLKEAFQRAGAYERQFKASMAEGSALIEKMRTLQKGDTGAQGPRGFSVKGDKGDMPTIDIGAIAKKAAALISIPKDGRDAIVDTDAIVRQVLSMIPTPENGKDGVVDYAGLEKKMMAELKKNKKVKVSDIEGLNPALEDMLKRYGAYVHGGGDTVAAGTNIILTRDANGNVVINAQGGSAGTTVVTQYSLTAIQSASDVTIDLTQLTNWAAFSNVVAVYRNNVPQTETINFTIVGSTLTIFGADASEVFNVTYGYSS